MWTERASQTIARSRLGTPICRYLIELAAGKSSLEMVKFLLNRGARLDISNALHVAAAGGTSKDETERVKIIEFLLEKGMDINKLEFAGEEDFPKQYGSRAYGTPLHYAASWGWAEIVECLLKNGADPNIEAFCYKKNVHCGTALDWQKLSEPDEGTYSRRVLMLLGDKKDKL
jgi:ankyrin repeat protein